MTTGIFALAMLVEVLLMGGIFLLYPRFARRGLLFGVYVGEQAWAGDEARRITHEWYTGMSVWIALTLVLGMALWAIRPSVAIAPVAPILLLVGFLVLYLRAYGQARRLAPEGPAPLAATVLTATSAANPILPFTAVAFGVACGAVAISYAASHYTELPRMVPTHFGMSGTPDAWRPKSFSTVMLLPLMTLVIGVSLGVVAFLTSRAKRGLRYPLTEVSAAAQARFREAMTRYISVVGMTATLMLTLMAISSIRVALGLERGLSPIAMILAGVLVVLGIAWTIYIGLRYGQGGARLERAASQAALTNGLADNRYWVLGMFYVNRDDPAIFVEHRFGLGYTINFGNWKAVALLVLFFGLLLGIALAALITN
jgi:uncharacterized membrane protein